MSHPPDDARERPPSSGRKRRRRILSTTAICLTAVAAFVGIFSNDAINEGAEVSIRARDLLQYIDDKVSAADWPPLSLVEQVADEKKRIAIAAANCAGVPLADNWANSLLTLGIENFIIVPLDSSAQITLEAAFPGHVAPVLPGLDDSKIHHAYSTFGMMHFKEVTSSRPTFIKAFVEKGFEVLYNDADMVWKQNLWDEVDQESDEDAVFVSDGAPSALCSCMMYMKPNKANIELLEIWRDEILTGWYENDQPAFNAAIHDRKHNVNWRHGDASKFPPGSRYFAMNQEEKTNVALVHANWLIGMKHKQARLVSSGNWNPSGRLDESLPCWIDINSLNRNQYMIKMAERSEKAQKKREKLEAERKARLEEKHAALNKGNGWDEASGLEINFLS